MKTLSGLLTLTVCGVVVLSALLPPETSGASFTARTVNPGAGVRAASDWTPPAVSLRDPGPAISGIATITAEAGDGETGVNRVTIQYQTTGGSTWTTLCEDTSAPYSCAWDTRAMVNGSYDLRATAVDNAGYTASSDVVRTNVTQDLTVVLDSPGDAVRGTVALNARVLNPGLLTLSVTIQYAVSGGTWRTLCVDAIPPYSCSWDTTAAVNDFHDLRAVATANLNTYTSNIVTDVLVDNLLPVVTMTDPGSPLRGSVTFSATASDVSSGVAAVTLQYAVAGSSGFATLCTVSAPPYSCRYDTTKLNGDGLYDFRAVATDAVGLTATSAVVRNRQVDNTVSSVSMEDPGGYLTGNVTLNASANSTGGVTSVTLQRSRSGLATWTEVCADTSSPYSCGWDSRTVADGSYDFRAVLLDGTGRTTTSTVVAGRTVDNAPLRGADVQSANGGLTSGRLESGDSITFTYSSQVDPSTVLTGWTGAAQGAFVRVRDGSRLGLGIADDTLDVFANSQLTTPVQLGSVNLKRDLVKTSKTVTFNATVTASTVTASGVVRTVVTVRLGTAVTASGVRTSAAAGAMVWTPAAAARSLTGQSCSVAPATESGTADKDF